MKSIVASTSKWFVLALALTLTTTTCVDAVIVKASDIARTRTDLGKFQTLEKTWNVSGSTGLHNLIVQAPGSVFVDYDSALDTHGSDALAAKVVLTGDSEDLLSAFQVLPWDGPKGEGLELRFQPQQQQHDFQGHVFTHILIGDKQVLQSIKSLSSADIVISDNVLANNNANASLELSVLGSGDVAVVSTQELQIGSLSIFSAGSGDVELQSPLINTTTSISVSSLGSGDVAIIADEIRAHAVAITSVGSGNVAIQADNIVAYSMDSLVAGSGYVSSARNGSCVNQTATLTGSGKLALGSIISQFAEVGVYGSGDAVVQAKEKLVATMTGTGDLHYMDHVPREVVVRGLPSSSHRGHHSYEKRIKQARHQEYEPYVPHRHERIPRRVVVHTKHSGHFVSIDDDDDESDDDSFHDGVLVIRPFDSDDDDFAMQNLAVAPLSGAHLGQPAVIASCAGVIMVVVALVAGYKFRQQRCRAEYSPLVAVTTSAS
ncbi:hypothetical protein Gpo141_00006793 [Globisporangium polare]